MKSAGNCDKHWCGWNQSDDEHEGWMDFSMWHPFLVGSENIAAMLLSYSILVIDDKCCKACQLIEQGSESQLPSVAWAYMPRTEFIRAIWHYMTLLTWWNLVNLMRGAECLSTPWCCQGHEPRPRSVAAMAASAMSAVATAPMALMALAAVNVARPRRRRDGTGGSGGSGGSGRYWTWKLEDLKSSCCWKNRRFIFFGIGMGQIYMEMW